MTNVQSRFLTTVACTCKEFQHPWTERCVDALAGIILASTPYSLRLYTVVYALSLVMRHRIPTMNDLKNTIKGIVQSSCFLITNSFSFILYNCILRQMIGFYTPGTVAFLPAFLASLTAIVVERPARRPLLALYVANVATESLWSMAESRGLVQSLPYGQTAIFGVSVSILLYLYRLGLHKSICKDSLFNILGIFVGKSEAGPIPKSPDVDSDDEENVVQQPVRSRPPLDFSSISGLVQIYGRFINRLKKKHDACPHQEPCLQYAVLGGLKPFLGGVTLQVVLKLLLNIKKIAQMKMNWRKTLFNQSTLKLGIFLGSFSLLYKTVTCFLRHGFGCDDPLFAIPAGLVSSVAFSQYPDITVALYVMWKMFQVTYNIGIHKRWLPNIPGFTIFLYCFSTATLFHAALIEPNNLRLSYYKFLQALSGGRLGHFNYGLLDVFGLNTSRSTNEVLRKLNMIPKTKLPRFALAS